MPRSIAARAAAVGLGAAVAMGVIVVPVAAQLGDNQTCPIPAAARMAVDQATVPPDAEVAVRGTGWAPDSSVRVEINSAENARNIRAVTADAEGSWLLRIAADSRAPSSMLFSAVCGTDTRSARVMIADPGDNPTSTTDARAPATTTAPDDSGGGGGFPWWLLLLAALVVALVWWQRQRRRGATGAQ